MRTTIIMSADALKKALVDLFLWADSVDMAFAWANSSEGVAQHWRSLDIGKIRRAAIGVAFAGKEPAALLDLHRASDRLRIVHQKSGTFHPKVMLGRRGQQSRALVGSANVTVGAYTVNTELCVLLEGAMSDRQMREIEAFIKDRWEEGSPLDLKWLAKYEASFKRARSQRGKIKIPPLSTCAPRLTALNMTWTEYVELINAQEDRLARIGFAVRPADGRRSYFEELDDAAKLFRAKGGFAHLSKASCNFLMGKGDSSGLLGSMGGAGAAMHIAQNSPAKLAEIDKLPSTGAVALTDVEILLRALTKPKGVGLGVATRLMAAKRPDLFVSINRGSEPKLAKARNGGRVRSIKQYLAFLRELWSTDWHRARRPAAPEERAIWNRRAALMDAALYETVPSRQGE